MSDDYTPGEFWAGFGKWIGTVLALCVIGGVIIFAGWQAGWWFSNQNVNRQFQQTQNGQSNQVTLREQIEKNFALLTQDNVAIAKAKGDPGLTGQYKVEAAATAGTLCQEGDEVNRAVPLPQDIAAWLGANCSMGVVAPTSQYFIPSA